MATRWFCDVCGKEMEALNSKTDNFVTHTTFCWDCYSIFVDGCKKVLEEMKKKTQLPKPPEPVVESKKSIFKRLWEAL